MAKRGRQPGFTMSDEHRAKIRIVNILNALQEHVEGTRDMSATQVNAAATLLRKVMPDLATIEHSGEVQQTYVARMPARIADLGEWQKRHQAPETVQ